MKHTRYSLTCDACNRQEYSEGDDEETEMRLWAHAKGWRRHKVENGSTWDFCPNCAKAYPHKAD